MSAPPGHSLVHLICSMSRASRAGPAPACSIVISTAGKTGGFLLVVSECKGADEDHPNPAYGIPAFRSVLKGVCSQRRQIFIYSLDFWSKSLLFLTFVRQNSSQAAIVVEFLLHCVCLAFINVFTLFTALRYCVSELVFCKFKINCPTNFFEIKHFSTDSVNFLLFCRKSVTFESHLSVVKFLYHMILGMLNCFWCPFFSLDCLFW